MEGLPNPKPNRSLTIADHVDGSQVSTPSDRQLDGYQCEEMPGIRSGGGGLTTVWGGMGQAGAGDLIRAISWGGWRR